MSVDNVIKKLQRIFEDEAQQLPTTSLLTTSSAIDISTDVDIIEELKRLTKEVSRPIAIYIEPRGPAIAEVRYRYVAKDGRTILGEAVYFTSAWRREDMVTYVCEFASKAALLRRLADMALIAPDAIPQSGVTLDADDGVVSVVLSDDMLYGYFGGKIFAAVGDVVFIMRDIFRLTQVKTEELLRAIIGIRYKAFVEAEVDCAQRISKIITSTDL